MVHDSLVVMYSIPSREHRINKEGLIKRQEMKNTSLAAVCDIFGNQSQLLNVSLFCLPLNIDSKSLSDTIFSE